MLKGGVYSSFFDEGVARVRCPNCGHEFLIAFSCKLRGLCPSYRMLLGKEPITETLVDNLLSWRHGGFSAHGAARVEDRQGAILDFSAAQAIRKSLKLPAQKPEPLAHAPPERFELVAESACACGFQFSPPGSLGQVRLFDGAKRLAIDLEPFRQGVHAGSGDQDGSRSQPLAS